MIVRVEATGKRNTGWHAHWRDRCRLREPHALSRDAIQIWRLYLRVPGATHGVCPLLVRHHDQNVRSRGHLASPLLERFGRRGYDGCRLASRTVAMDSAR